MEGLEIPEIPDFSRRFTEILYSYQQQRHLCDCLIITNNGSIPAHRLVLSMASPYFTSVINSSEDMKFPVPFDIDVVGTAVRLLYTGKLMVSKDNIQRIAEFCSYLQLKDGLSLCENFLKNDENERKAKELVVTSQESEANVGKVMVENNTSVGLAMVGNNTSEDVKYSDTVDTSRACHNNNDMISNTNHEDSNCEDFHLYGVIITVKEDDDPREKVPVKGCQDSYMEDSNMKCGKMRIAAHDVPVMMTSEEINVSIKIDTCMDDIAVRCRDYPVEKCKEKSSTFDAQNTVSETILVGHTDVEISGDSISSINNVSDSQYTGSDLQCKENDSHFPENDDSEFTENDSQFMENNQLSAWINPHFTGNSTQSTWDNTPQYSGNDPQYTGNDPKCTGNDPQCTGNNPQCTGNDLQCTESDLQCTGNDPKRTGNVLQCTGNDLQCTGNDPKRTGIDPQCTGNDLQCTGNDPKHTGNLLQCTEIDPQCTGNDLQCTGIDPQCTGNDLQCTGIDPQYSGNYPKRTGNDPQCTGNDTKCTGNDPKCTGYDPQCTGNDPKHTGHDPLCTGNDPQCTGNDQQSSDSPSIYQQPKVNNPDSSVIFSQEKESPTERYNLRRKNETKQSIHYQKNTKTAQRKHTDDVKISKKRKVDGGLESEENKRKRISVQKQTAKKIATDIDSVSNTSQRCLRSRRSNFNTMSQSSTKSRVRTVSQDDESNLRHRPVSHSSMSQDSALSPTSTMSDINENTTTTMAMDAGKSVGQNTCIATISELDKSLTINFQHHHVSVMYRCSICKGVWRNKKDHDHFYMKV